MRPLSLSLFLVPAFAIAQPPPGYYDPAAGLSGESLLTALNDIISPHTVLQYSDLWGAFYRTDRKADNTVWDIYSDVPSGIPPYSYQFGTDQCGTYNSEGDCFNREHSFPVSWFNDLPPMNSDLFHIYPTDAWVNQARGNWPYGTVSSAAFTSENGGERGPCTWPGCTGTVFEPINAYKGDLARGYFYMLTRYMNESTSWPAPILISGELIGWAEGLLLAWHAADPVSQKEIARNDSIFLIQGNRNPYIDNPHWVYSIWGPQAGVSEVDPEGVHIRYADGMLTLDLSPTASPSTVRVLDALGRQLIEHGIATGRATLAVDFPPGAYVAMVISGERRTLLRFVR